MADSSRDSNSHISRKSPSLDLRKEDEATNPNVVEKDPLAAVASPNEIPSPESDCPPNGGLRAWSQVIAGHLVIFNSFGYINSYGIFQQYYATTLHQSPSNISWIGSIAIFLVYGLGMFSGRLMDAGYYRPTIMAGLFMQVLGVFMTSLSTEYWQLFLAQGLCQGIGNGLVFCPTLASISQYFTTRRAVAIACVASGGGTGGLVFPAIAQNLLHRIGFGWTLRVMGFVVLFNAIVILTLARPRNIPRPAGVRQPVVDFEAFKDLPYTLYCLGVFCNLWGTFFAYYYVRPYARNILHVHDQTTFSILLIINGVGIPGRIVPALISDRWTGPVNLLIIAAAVGGITLYCWAAVDSLGGMYAFVSVFGLPGGAVQSLFPAGVSSITSDMNKIGIRMGMVFTIASFGSFTGPPIAGALIQNHMGQYLNAQIFGGTVLICGSLFVLAGRISRTGWKLKVRM